MSTFSFNSGHQKKNNITITIPCLDFEIVFFLNIFLDLTSFCHAVSVFRVSVFRGVRVFLVWLS